MRNDQRPMVTIKDVARVVITRDVVLEHVYPTLVPREKESKRERREKSA